MVSIFNWKELLITYDMKKQSEVRTALKNNEIEYKVTCIGMFDFDYDRVGVILYTDSKEGRENKLYRKNPRKTGSVYSIGR